MSFRRPSALTVLAACIVSLTIAILVAAIMPDPPGRGTVIAALDGPDRDTKRDDVVALGPQSTVVFDAASKTPERFDLGGDLRGVDPKPAGVISGPLASQEWPGCRTAFVKAFSARTSTVRAVGLHYTAGGNVPGLADMYGLTAYSNRLANQVSWHFLIDREGHCFYSVPTNHKAWTISGLNSQTVNIEVIGRGTEPDYAGTAGMRKLAAVVQRIGRVHNIPIRLGATDRQCNVTRRGIITHWMGGACSGGHIDIKPYSIQKVVDAIAKISGKPRRLDRIRCRKINWWRSHGRPPGLPHVNARFRRGALDRRGLTCTTSGIR